MSVALQSFVRLMYPKKGMVADVCVAARFLQAHVMMCASSDSFSLV